MIFILQKHCPVDKGKDNEKRSMGRPSHTSQVRYHLKYAIIGYLQITPTNTHIA